VKIMLANERAAKESDRSGQFVKNVVIPAWRKNFDLVRRKDTEIIACFPKWGVTGLNGLSFSFIHTLNAQSVLHAAIRAERDGYDGLLISCFSDPLLYQIRQTVNIPVVSLGESSMLLASMMGHKFGIVTISPYAIFEQEQIVAKYGLAHRFVGCKPNPEPADEQSLALIDARHAIEAFKRAGRELIVKGAEVLIPGSEFLSPALRLAPGAEAEYPGGMTEVDGVPVMDVMAAGLKMAETMVTIKRSGSPWVSRKGLFARATKEALAEGAMVLKDDRMGYWDVAV
jgi:allantoin racemase